MLRDAPAPKINTIRDPLVIDRILSARGEQM